VLADYLAAGIDPNLTTICLQSALPALAELTMLYMNIVTVARVERNPTVKNEIAQKGFARSLPVGFMAYPISQAADITAFRAECVPVGDDQLPMIEQTNEIVHKMNSLLPAPVLRHCKAMLSDTSRLPGIDGSAKMSKSLGNTLHLSASEEAIHQAVSAIHGPNSSESERPRADNGQRRVYLPGCVSSGQNQSGGDEGALSGWRAWGPGMQNVLEACLQELIAPMRERRAMYMQDKGELMAMLKRGTERAQGVTQGTLREVKAGLGMPVM
jgi:tryptophanyl-tRNA synthetase